MHIDPEELVEFLYAESLPARQTEIAQHLASCEECRELIASWKQTRNQLQAWKLAPVPPRTLSAKYPVLWRAIAAVLLVGLGFGLGKMFFDSQVDAGKLRTEVVEEVRGQLQAEFSAKLAQLETHESAHQAENLQGQQVVLGLLRQIENQQKAIYSGLREDVETVAIHTQEEFNRLADWKSAK